MDFLDNLEAATRPDVAKKPWFDQVEMHLVTQDTLDRVIDECIAAERYAFDLETTGLDNRVFNGETQDKIVGFCLASSGTKGYYIPIRHKKGESHNLPIPVVYDAIRRLAGSDAVAVFHNAKFDLEFLEYPGGDSLGSWDVARKWEDTHLLAWLRNTRDKSLGLKALSKRELGKEMIELPDLFGKDHGGSLNFADLDPSWEPCVWYACSDAICTYLLYDVLHPEVTAPDGNRNQGQEVVYNLEKMCLAATRWMERCRVYIDQSKVAELTQLGQLEYFQAMCDIYDFCNKALGDKRPPDPEGGALNVEPGWFRLLRKNFISDDPDYPISKQIEDCRKLSKTRNLDALDEKGNSQRLDAPHGAYPQKYDILSRPQLGPLFEELEIPDLNRTERSGQVQTTQSEIERLNTQFGDKYPFLPKIKRLGELQKALSTYLISLHRDVGPDGTLRVNYKQTGTDTGRFTTPSSKRPELDGGTKYPMHGTPAPYDKSRPQCLLRIREAIKARPGKTMVAIDFGGVELRIATILSGEPKWLAEYFRCSSCGHKFDAGDGESTPEAPPAYCPTCGDDRIGDLHTLTGITFYGEDKVGTKEWKQMRQGAKSTNFALAYGGGPSAIMRSIPGTDAQEAARHHRAFNQTYGTLKAWWDMIKNFGRKKGYVTTAFGRHYPIPDILLPTRLSEVQKIMEEEYPVKLARWEEQLKQAATNAQREKLMSKKPRKVTEAVVRERAEMNQSFKAKAERNATNGPIQGLSADITKLAMALIYKEVKKREWFSKVYMIITIHDELVFEVDNDILAEAVEVFQSIMTRNKTILGMGWQVPLTTDCEIGSDWTVPYDVKDFRHKRVRPDGIETDHKGTLFKDKDGKITAKVWPKNLVECFGPRYGYAPVIENLSQEEGLRLFGDSWRPLPLDTDGGNHSDSSAADDVLVGSDPQEAPVEEPAQPQAPTPPPPSDVTTSQNSTSKDGVHTYRLNRLGIGVADKLAHVIVQCQGRGSHKLEIVGPDGMSILWSGADICVNPIEFDTAANYHGI